MQAVTAPMLGWSFPGLTTRHAGLPPLCKTGGGVVRIELIQAPELQTMWRLTPPPPARAPCRRSPREANGTAMGREPGQASDPQHALDR